MIKQLNIKQIGRTNGEKQPRKIDVYTLDGEFIETSTDELLAKDTEILSKAPKSYSAKGHTLKNHIYAKAKYTTKRYENGQNIFPIWNTFIIMVHKETTNE